MKTMLVGVGAAGGKAVKTAIMNGTVEEKDTVIINSTNKDIPKDYKGKIIIISPNDGKNGGCGKERSIAKDYALTSIKAGKMAIEAENYTSIFMITSVEGGTGSGATPLIAQFFNKVYRKNVHLFAFTGFEEDVRGISNTVSFFQEIDPALIIHVISNKKFLEAAGGNKIKAEQMANEEFCKRINIITGKDFIDSDQNIDDTDILKVSNTSGYTAVEKAYIDKSLVDQNDFNKLIKKMIYDSSSIKSTGATRIGVILNLKPESEDAVDYSFASIKANYGNSYESFLQKQWDGKREYIAYIVSGMSMPLDEIKAVHERYLEESSKVNKKPDDFFTAVKDMTIQDEDKKFDMIRPAEAGISLNEFLAELETK